MIKIVEFTTKSPILVSRLIKPNFPPQILAIPEGGTMGFCGKNLWARTGDGRWECLLTNKDALVKWLDNGHITKKAPVETDSYKALRKKLEAHKQKAAKA